VTEILTSNAELTQILTSATRGASS
jgi:hypothetical protein